LLALLLLLSPLLMFLRILYCMPCQGSFQESAMVKICCQSCCCCCLLPVPCCLPRCPLPAACCVLLLLLLLLLLLAAWPAVGPLSCLAACPTIPTCWFSFRMSNHSSYKLWHHLLVSHAGYLKGCLPACLPACCVPGAGLPEPLPPRLLKESIAFIDF